MYRTETIAYSAPAVDELVAARIRDGRAPASSYALFGPGGVVATGSAGGEARPAPHVAFRVASCTKSVTAATLLTFVEEGRLALAQPVTEVLDLEVLGGFRPPTLGELLSMSGGIPYDDPWADRQEALTAPRMAALLADGVRLVREPGTGYEYSSYGYAILGSVLERVSGTSFDRLATERVLDPLGISGLGFHRETVGPVATGFAKVEGAWVAQPWQEPGGFSALGGLIATPSALATWATWLAAAWRDTGDAVLPAAARRRMQTGVTPMPGTTTRYGLGLMIEQHDRHGTIVSHSGGYPGYGANMRWHPASGIGVVVLENARYSGASVPATQALVRALDSAWVPAAEPALWPETLEARAVAERLLRDWSDAALGAVAADNVVLDVAFPARAAEAARLRDRIGLTVDMPVAPLRDAAPHSDSPAHLDWTVFGPAGAIRCEVRLTPTRRPRVETLEFRLG